MSLPNLADLQQINQLLAQIQRVEQDIARLQSDLEQTKAKHSQEEKSLHTQTLQREVNRLALEKTKENLAELRQQENQIRQDIQNLLEQAIQSYLDSPDFTDFLHQLIQKANRQGSAKILAGSDTAKYLPKDISYSGRESGCLRIQTESKTYILDIPKLKHQLLQKLLIHTLTSA